MILTLLHHVFPFFFLLYNLLDLESQIPICRIIIVIELLVMYSQMLPNLVLVSYLFSLILFLLQFSMINCPLLINLQFYLLPLISSLEPLNKPFQTSIGMRLWQLRLESYKPMTLGPLLYNLLEKNLQTVNGCTKQDIRLMIALKDTKQDWMLRTTLKLKFLILKKIFHLRLNSRKFNVPQ